jgi:hypothetical protein
MATTAQAVLNAAAVWRNRVFSEERYGASPYCASFVRWCFKQVNGTRLGLPEVSRVPYYVRKGIHVSPGPWFADSLAGEEVGPVVQHQQPGDLLFFHDTARGPWPVGSITHVGIALDSGDLMADAGSGSVVHFRSHRATFPGKLVEIRRPLALGTISANAGRRTAITIARGQAFGMMRGQHVRHLTVELSRQPGGDASAPTSSGRHRSIFEVPNPTMNQMLGGARGGASASGGSGSGSGGNRSSHSVEHKPMHQGAQDHLRMHWTIAVNERIVKPIHSAHIEIAFAGRRFKMFAHDQAAQAFLDGAPVDDATLRVALQNGAAHVWLNGSEVKPDRAEIEVIA